MASNSLVPATPQRALPGAYFATPAPQSSIFSQPSQVIRQQQQQPEQNGQPASTPSLSAIERAAKTINDTLDAEARFPALEDYVQNGVTADYDLPRNPAYNPFQALKSYEFPPKILEQANQTSMKMNMGMFAQIGHAWAAIDNCLYLWDYTMPNPTLIGFEENKNTIEAVRLVKPRAGVFVKEITHVIVVATTVEMLLLGVAPTTTATGGQTIALYTTKLSIATRGIGVKFIQGSSDGRIFFVGSFTDDIHEFEYHEAERWFSNRTARVTSNKSGTTSSRYPDLTSIYQFFGSVKQQGIEQLVVDSSRSFIYTLTSANEIQIWAIKDRAYFCMCRTLQNLLQTSGHFTSHTELLTGKEVWIATLSTIPSTESSRLALVATTNTGCRLYISLTRGFSQGVDANSPPTSMALTHVRLPPTDPTAVSKLPLPSQPSQSTQANQLEATSKYLMGTESATRLPPGYTIMILPDTSRSNRSRAFCLAEDSARLKNAQDPSPLASRFSETGQWVSLPENFNDLQVIGPSFAANPTPQGFGNEMAVQFDKPALELGLMTASNIQILRRRRLVDTFAGLLRHASTDDEGVEGDIKRFIRLYGRSETAATAVAVACGQGLDVTSDLRVANVTDPEVLERARSAFIEHGGKPEYNPNAIIDGTPAVDTVKPSPRFEGLSLYVSRLVRSIWKSRIVTQQIIPGQLPQANPVVPQAKLRDTQKRLTDLQQFLEKNRSFIEGLAPRQTIGRIGAQQDEIASQGEHRAMDSLSRLITQMIEGISFALVLFDEKIGEILATLSEDLRTRVLDLTYESLFASSSARELAKELVKAIVNRNIASGSNVETVAEALRRRCGSFCSSDDVIVFKAQEQVKKAQQTGAQTETGRALLNESQRYFQKAANALSMEHLQWAIEQYIQAQFWAGAVQLCLAVASEKDRAGRAISWVRDGMPEGDDKKAAFDARKRCYDLIFTVVQAMEDSSKTTPVSFDGGLTLTGRRLREADEVINTSTDEVFHNCLYDWYLGNGQRERLVESSSAYVAKYLERKSQMERDAADLLWQHLVHHNDFLPAAEVQLKLAKGFFDISLAARIEYLSKARINASTRQAALVENRQNRQQLLREISDLQEVSNIQDDILQRIKSDGRLGADRRQEVIDTLNGRILDIEVLFNQYADQASYHDICLLIYQCADHRNPGDIRNSWLALIDQTDREAQAIYGNKVAGWEAVGNKVREMGRRLNTSDAVFPVQVLFPMLERYAYEARTVKPPQSWAVELFLDLEIPHESLLPIAEQMFYSNEAPFTGSKRRIIAGDLVYIIHSWLKESLRKGEREVFGSAENASTVLDVLGNVLKGDNLLEKPRADAENIVAAVKRIMR